MSLRILHYSDVEAAYDDPDRVGRLAGLIRSRRDEATLVAGTGDNTAPGVLSLVSDGRQALDLFRAIDADVETFGNHDFDHGFDAARRIVRSSPQTWVSANVRHDGEVFGRTAGVIPWTVVERGGYRVGIVGVTDPTTASINPVAEPLTLTDPIAAVRDAVSTFRDRTTDYVVVLSHLGRGDEELVRAVDGIDAVLGGHVHTERIDRVNGAILTRPGVNAEAVVEVTLGPDGPAATRHAIDDAPVAVDVASSIRRRSRSAALHERVMTVDDPIERTEETAHGGESRIGNLVADAYRWATDADVALQNGGGIRTGPPLADEVTVADLMSVVPFEEPVAVAAVTGSELRSIVEEGDGAKTAFGDPDWWHAHVSGMAVRMVDGEVVDLAVGDEPVDPDTTYTIATSDYLLYTDTEFPTLEASHRVETGETQYDVIVEYAREVGLDPVVEGRIVRE